MPSKKKKYNARFPAGRIKKIMQTDEDVGKVAQAVPVIISVDNNLRYADNSVLLATDPEQLQSLFDQLNEFRHFGIDINKRRIMLNRVHEAITLELFVESLLTKSIKITQTRNAKTLTPSHMKQCILSESRFDFLKDLVKNVPDASAQEDNENNLLFDASMDNLDSKLFNSEASHNSQTSSGAVTQNHNSSEKTDTVIRYGPAVIQNTEVTTSKNMTFRRDTSEANSNNSFTNSKPEKWSRIANKDYDKTKSDVGEEFYNIVTQPRRVSSLPKLSVENVPPLSPISTIFNSQNKSDYLVIDEDYDN